MIPPPLPPPADTAFNRGAAFLLGLLLPLLTLTRDYYGTPQTLSARVAPVDIVCIVLLVSFLLFQRMQRLPWSVITYVAAVMAALIPAYLFSKGPLWYVCVQLSGILMAVGFFVAGLNVAATPGLFRSLLAGLGVAVAGEAVVVYHDFLSSSPWFPDPMEGRVRGTFKANGQLGAFGFCAAGLLATFGLSLAPPRTRWLYGLAAVVAASFVFLASRRAGMIAVASYGVFFALVGMRRSGDPSYRRFVGTYVVLMASVLLFWPQLSGTFAGRRFTDAMSSLRHDDGFVQRQLQRILETADHWFPLGFGIGRGQLIDPVDGHEIHNGLAAVLVESGVPGLAAFLWMIAGPAVRVGGATWFGVLLRTFTLACIVFMLHNTLYRDRTYLLFLGLAATATRLREPDRAPEAIALPLRPCREGA